jgi:hypothetical protein
MVGSQFPADRISQPVRAYEWNASREMVFQGHAKRVVRNRKKFGRVIAQKGHRHPRAALGPAFAGELAILRTAERLGCWDGKRLWGKRKTSRPDTSE